MEPLLARELRQFLRCLDEYFQTQVYHVPDEYSQVEQETVGDGKQFLIESPRPFFESLRPTLNRLSVRYMLDKIESGRAIPDDPMEEFLSELGKFYSVLGMEGEEFSHLYDMTDGESLKIVCKDASRFVAERLEGFHSVIAMSATLEPMEFYERMLGFDAERTDCLKLPSPFPPENRRILIMPNVSTTFRQRGGNYEEIAAIIATTAEGRAATITWRCFPATSSCARPPGIWTSDKWQLIVQEPGLSEPARQAILDSLKTIIPPKLVMAVQGGIFAEGVDYPGETLSGVIVVSPALPQVSFERELMRQYYQKNYGKGFEFAYLYPGMNRVIQSVGRLIRTETDCGVAVLVCQRFAHAQYSSLFPNEWVTDGLHNLISKNLPGDLAEFWAGRAPGGVLWKLPPIFKQAIRN